MEVCRTRMVEFAVLYSIIGHLSAPQISSSTRCTRWLELGMCTFYECLVISHFSASSNFLPLHSISFVGMQKIGKEGKICR